MTSKAVLQSLFAELPMLHWFGMDDCVIEKLEEEAEDVEPELEPVATLRYTTKHKEVLMDKSANALVQDHEACHEVQCELKPMMLQ